MNALQPSESSVVDMFTGLFPLCCSRQGIHAIATHQARLRGSLTGKRRVSVTPMPGNPAHWVVNVLEPRRGGESSRFVNFDFGPMVVRERIPSSPEE